MGYHVLKFGIDWSPISEICPGVMTLNVQKQKMGDSEANKYRGANMLFSKIQDGGRWLT